MPREMPACRSYDRGLRKDESLLVGLVQTFEERLSSLKSRIIRNAFAGAAGERPADGAQQSASLVAAAPVGPARPAQAESVTWWQWVLQIRLAR